MRSIVLTLLTFLLPLACDERALTAVDEADEVEDRGAADAAPDGAADARPLDAQPLDAQPLDAAAPAGRLLTQVLDFATIVAEERALGVIQVENISNAPWTVQAVEGLAAPFAVPDGLLPLPAEVGRTADILVQFAPLGAGDFEQSVRVLTGGGTFSVTVRGSATPAPPRRCLEADVRGVDFGRVGLGQTTAMRWVRVENCGNVPLRASEISLEDEDFQWNLAEGGLPVDLEPGAGFDLLVWYHNTALAEGQVAQGTLTVRTPSEALVEVPLFVVGGGPPICDLLVVPNRLNFGLVRRGSSKTLRFNLVNRGTGACQLRSETLEPIVLVPGVPSMFTIQPLGPIVIPPGDWVPLEATYLPVSLGNHTERYTATYWDPIREEEHLATAELSGLGTGVDVRVFPTHVDFGTVTADTCASTQQSVVFTNAGAAPACLRAVRLEGACDDFLLLNPPVAQDGCIAVAAANPLVLDFVFQPAAPGSFACTLIAESDDAEVAPLQVTLRGIGAEGVQTTDTFDQEARVDLLFVVDHSPSPLEELDLFQAALPDLPWAGDYQVGVITTDLVDPAHQGQLQGALRILRPGRDVAADLAAIIEGLGSAGSDQEEGLEAARRALSEPLTFDAGLACGNDGDCALPTQCFEGTCGGTNRGFVRPGATLGVVFISDEDDASRQPVATYVDFFNQIKGLGRRSRVFLSAVVGAVGGQPADCQNMTGGAIAGTRYVNLVRALQGDVFSICDADFRPTVRALGERLFALPTTFPLSRRADPTSLLVRVDERIQVEDWLYQAEGALVEFRFAPAEGRRVRIDYAAECLPRR